MATAVYNSEEIELLDGSTLMLRSLTIRNRRKFMKAFDALASQEPSEDRTYEDEEDSLLKLVPYCVTGQRPEWEGIFSKDEEDVEKALDAMGNALDEESVYYIIKQTVGIDLKAMAQQTLDLIQKTELAGTNLTSPSSN